MSLPTFYLVTFLHSTVFFCYNKAMTIRQFLFMAFVCAFETYFFNDLLLSGNYLFALFWGLLLFRDLRRVHTINQLTKTILKAANSPKKKD
ncbi:DUF3272 domain-containing protein [Streptococcus pyogenes]|nr:DUF3272 domain-containing protein [Streptococcus pyogenes]PWV34784.1 DUF3272 domain-containing protein [Streptococcus pyogenes]QCK60022.1 DUF3272 family protein [Streptococcus pyogenes]RXS20036.1 DUF3272 family protein [Streptococcus pyogenes]